MLAETLILNLLALHIKSLNKPFFANYRGFKGR